MTSYGAAAFGAAALFHSAFFYVSRIRDRRFVLVDSERGLVFAG